MCATWLARTEQRLELIGFAQLMPSVVRFWPQRPGARRRAGEPPPPASLSDLRPFAYLDPPQTFALRSDEILGNARQMVWKSGRALQARPTRTTRSGAELEPANAGVMEYAHFPKFVPTHVTNFGNTTSRSAARRNLARAGPGPDFAIQRHSRFLLQSWRHQNRIQNQRHAHLRG